MPRRPLAYLPLAVTLICLALAANMAMTDPRYIVPLVFLLALMVVPVLLARRRMRAVLLSGDVKRVLGSWQGSVDRVMYPETMAPLMAATAYASYGWIDAARRSLSRAAAAKGPAWDAAIEQRLFVETLLHTFEGDRDAAAEKSRALVSMPIAPAGLLTRKRVAALRDGLAAMVRAFSHESRAEDLATLRRASKVSPLVHWAMRYAAAIVAVDAGEKERARALLVGAPAWPEESAFRLFHEELCAAAA